MDGLVFQSIDRAVANDNLRTLGSTTERDTAVCRCS
jgi:hypothetical protein